MGGIHYTYAKWVTHMPHRLLLDNVFFFLVPFRIVHNFKLMNHLFVKLFISKIFRSCLMVGDGNKKKANVGGCFVFTKITPRLL